MKVRSHIVLLILLSSLSLGSTIQSAEEDRYVFFLHNRFLEEHGLEEEHPIYGRAQYIEIVTNLEENGLQVISEKREGDVDIYAYAVQVVKQVDSLISTGVPSDHITIVGTSKGGYIAQYVSSIAMNSELNYVFIACYTDGDLERLPDIEYCGDILTIYERSDAYGLSAAARIDASSCVIHHFREIELDTGLGHGFLFSPMEEWMTPTIQWANGDHALK